MLVEKQVVGGGRRNAACYRCGSLDRERLVYVYLKDYLRIFDPGNRSRVLHIAPERRLMVVLGSAPGIEYVCGDKFPERYGDPAGVETMDVLDLCFSDGTFELVICNHVLEHIPADQAAMTEILRVLKPGGKAILQVPLSLNSEKTLEDDSITSREGREEQFGQWDHVRIYGQDYGKRLARAGFQVERVKIAGTPGYERAGLNPMEELFVANKPA